MIVLIAAERLRLCNSVKIHFPIHVQILAFFVVSIIPKFRKGD